MGNNDAIKREGRQKEEGEREAHQQHLHGKERGPELPDIRPRMELQWFEGRSKREGRQGCRSGNPKINRKRRSTEHALIMTPNTNT